MPVHNESDSQIESQFKILFKHFFRTRIRQGNYVSLYIVSLFFIILVAATRFIPPIITPGTPHPEPVPCINSLPALAFILNETTIQYSPNTTEVYGIMSQFPKAIPIKNQEEAFNEVIDGSNQMAVIFDSFNEEEGNTTIRTLGSMDTPGYYTTSLGASILGSSIFENFFMRFFSSVTFSDKDSMNTAMMIMLPVGFTVLTSGSVGFDNELMKERGYFLMFVNGLSELTFDLTYFLFLISEGVFHFLASVIMLSFVLDTRGANPLLVIVSVLLYQVEEALIDVWRIPLSRSVAICVVVTILQILVAEGGVYLGMYEQYISSVVFWIINCLLPGCAFAMSCVLCYTQRPMTFANIGKGVSFSYWKCMVSQVINCVIWGILAVLNNLCAKREHGRPPLGWRNLFNKAAWKKILEKHYKIVGNEPTLTLRNVNKTYENGTTALKNVNLSIGAGEIIGIIGPNGSGKSTLLNLLVGEFDFDSGEVEAFGSDISLYIQQIHPYLGVVFQDDVVYKFYTVRETLELYGRLQKMNLEYLDNEIARLADMLHLTDRLDTKTSELSGGEKRRFSISLALLHHPDFLLLDEPTTGVDAEARSIIWKTVSNLKDCTTLITTHALEEAEHVTSRLVVMNEGEVIFLGTAADLRLHYDCGYILTDVDGKADMEKLLGYVQGVYENAKISPNNERSIIFQADEKVEEVLDIVEEKKAECGLENYTLHLENLEDTLVKFIMSQEVLIT